MVKTNFPGGINIRLVYYKTAHLYCSFQLQYVSYDHSVLSSSDHYVFWKSEVAGSSWSPSWLYTYTWSSRTLIFYENSLDSRVTRVQPKWFTVRFRRLISRGINNSRNDIRNEGFFCSFFPLRDTYNYIKPRAWFTIYSVIII